MKKFLPVFFSIFFLISIFLFFPHKIYAAISIAAQPQVSLDGNWEADADVTFAGKTAARANDFVNWSLKDYNWTFIGNGQSNPLISFWITMRNIVYAFLTLFILATAFLMIIFKGKNITIMKFIPKFAMVILLITFSFALVQFLYQITDIIQGFFLKTSSGPISSSNLLSVGFNYKDFLGLRRVGIEFDESVFASLLLVKATAATYYVMSGMLLIRKIILWFFVIISPILPLLLFYYPIWNTAKAWVSEFFRWLLYGPLFAILLAGLVSLWKSSIPLNFNFSSTESYPTAVNILLGGPGQTVSLTNNLNNPDTFAQYIVALLMLWVVIFLPFILLHVFLDYVFAIPANSPAIKQIVNSGVGFFNRSSISSSSPTPIPPKPLSSQPTGLARSLPFIKQSFNAFGYNQSSRMSQAGSMHNNSEILKLSNLSIPTMRDIAKYETNLLSSDTTRKVEVSRVRESLGRISNPSLVASPLERGRYDNVKTQLVSEKQKGNPLASGILSAASYVSSVEAAKAGLQKIPASSPSLPVINRVQTVSFDDYESVKQLWQSNYRGMDVPKSVDQEDKTREEWIKGDIDKITDAINLLSSSDQQKVKEGMEKVSEILPMLLLGGFSQTEVIAYLKAKIEAAKSVMSELEKVQSEEETKVIASQKEEEKPKEMMAEATEEQEENKKEVILNDKVS